jgi:cytochrome P450
VSLAFRMAARGLFGFEGSQTEARISEVSVTLNRYLRARSRALVKLPIWLPTPANRAFQRAKRVLDDFARELIAQRSRAADQQDDVVTWLIDSHSRDQSDTTELRDEIVNLLTAGMETANVLSFAWAALARHPSAYRKLLDEVDSVLAGRAPTPDDLPKLVYTECVLSETMRLFPAVWLFARTATRDVEFGSRRVEAGALVGISPWSLHRHPSYWHKPEEFDPDRFAADASAKRTRFSYLPFGAGGRACVGMKMAIMESKIVLAMLSQQYRFGLLPSHPVEVEPSFMLRPRYGVRMSIHKR